LVATKFDRDRLCSIRMSRSEIRFFSCPILSNIAINNVLLGRPYRPLFERQYFPTSAQNKLTEKGSGKK
jgi:hypothetical protein